LSLHYGKKNLGPNNPCITKGTVDKQGITCLVKLPPKFIVPDAALLVCSHSITVDVSL